MNMLVMCIVQKHNNAQTIVERLRTTGFRNEDISVIFPNTGSKTTVSGEDPTMAPEGAVAGAGAGAVIGGGVGLALGLGALLIPGLGPFLAAGPLLASLGGAAAGTALGGLAGTLVGLGIPDQEAKRYEARVRGGHILIALHASSTEDARRAAQIFRTENADEIYSTVDPDLSRRPHPSHAGA